MSSANAPAAQSEAPEDVGGPNASYKEQLDKAAEKVKYPDANANNGGLVSQFVGKGKERSATQDNSYNFGIYLF